MNTYLTAVYISGIAFAYCIFLLVILDFVYKKTSVVPIQTLQYTVVGIVFAAVLALTTGTISYCLYLATKVY